jgi:hypothetical protein
MKKIYSLSKLVTLALCSVFLIITLVGCVSVNFSPGSVGGVTGSGNQETYTFSIGEITGIRVEMHCNIEYYSAPSDTVTLLVQPNLREYIVVEESGGVLIVRSTRSINTLNNPPVLTVSVPLLKSISLAGAGTITTHDTIVSEEFTLRLDGAGSGNVDLDVDKLSVNMAGAGSFDLSGRADAADFTLAGAGDVNALSLQTREATVNLAGVGTVRLSCSDRLSVIAGGLGTVEYKGSPNVDVTRGGLVSVQKVD